MTDEPTGHHVAMVVELIAEGLMGGARECAVAMRSAAALDAEDLDAAHAEEVARLTESEQEGYDLAVSFEMAMSEAHVERDALRAEVAALREDRAFELRVARFILQEGGTVKRATACRGHIVAIDGDGLDACEKTAVEALRMLFEEQDAALTAQRESSSQPTKGAP